MASSATSPTRSPGADGARLDPLTCLLTTAYVSAIAN